MKLRNCLLAAIMVASTAMVAMAQDKMFTPYASIRYFIGAYYQDKYMVNNELRLAPAGIAGVTPGTPYSDPAKYGTKADRYDLDLVNGMPPGISRFGGRFASGNFTGQVEFGLYSGHNGRVGVRQAWGAYKFDFGLKILAGNTDAPWYKPMGSEAWDVYGGPGSIQGDRGPRLKLSFEGVGTETSFVYVDLQRAPVVGSADESIGYWAQLYQGRDQIMPVTTIGYEYKSARADVGVGVTGYKYFFRKGAEASPQGSATGRPEVLEVDHSLMAYMAFANAHIKLDGPYAKLALAYQKAPYLLGLTDSGPFFNAGMGTSPHGILGDVLKPSDAFFEGGLELGYRIPDFIGVGVSFGYARNLNSDTEGTADRYAVGVNIDIPVDRGFRIVPSLLWMDERKDASKRKQGASCIAGVKLQLDL